MTRAALICGMLLLTAAMAGFASGSWESGEWIAGSGNVRSENRSVPGFTAIEVEGSGNVTLRQGNRQSLSVETDDNILPFVKTEVIGGVLHLGIKEGTLLRHMTRLEFQVTAPRVEGITISGSGDVHGGTPLQGDTLTLEIHGSGSIDAAIDVSRLQARIGGSGNIAVSGRADDETITINGSGGVRARDLLADTATVRISGSGDATLNVSQTISVDISGSGSVRYGGGAKSTVRTSGSGSVQQL
jgi:hypothetical protein